MDLLTFEPILKTTRWGGRRLGTVLNKPIGLGDRYAESWEIADFDCDQSITNSSPLNNIPIRKLLTEFKHELLGKHSLFNSFPLLVKFLDVADKLSLQVHPNNEYANTHQLNTSGKTEAWIILESQPDSKVYAGLKPGITPETLSKAIQSGLIDECVHSFHVNSGDAILVPAGTVHALGEGILLAEFQQMSHLTFRLHDWGRLDLNGKPRELHWDQALASINFDQIAITPESPTTIDASIGYQEFIRCKHFVIRKYQTANKLQFSGTDNYFRVFTIISGTAEIKQNNETKLYQTGQTILAPAETTDFSIMPLDKIELLESFLP